MRTVRSGKYLDRGKRRRDLGKRKKKERKKDQERAREKGKRTTRSVGNGGRRERASHVLPVEILVVFWQLPVSPQERKTGCEDAANVRIRML